MTQNGLYRRTLLAGGAMTALTRPVAFAQPAPIRSPVGSRRLGPGPLASSAGGPPPSLDLSFMTPGSMPSGVTFTRASTGTYFDAAGTLQTATTNTPRWDYDPVTHVLRGMLIEEARTNLLLNSAALGTQSITTTAVATTLSFYGTGTVTLSGTSTAGPLTGTGAANRVSLTFTPTAGTLTCTVTGGVTNAQVETGAFPTSYIPTTAAAATRAIEVANITPLGVWFDASTGSLAIEFDTVNPGSVEGGFSGGAFANVVYLNTAANGVASNVASVGQSQGGTAVAATGIVQKMAFAYSTGRLAACNNGSAVGTNVALSASPYLWTSNLCIGNAPWAITNSGTTLDGHMRRVRFWPRALSNAELQTT